MGHIEAVSNGLGGPSMLLLWLACERRIPATISITADTGAEEDRVCIRVDDSGALVRERISAGDFFTRYVQPLAEAHGIEAAFVRAVDGKGVAMPSLWEHTEQMLAAGRPNHVKVPLFGSQGGRLKQTCTSRWKITAIRQELRRRGATTARTAMGIHWDEAVRRVKGANRRLENGFWTYNDIDGTISAGKNKGQPRICKWSSHYYPLVELRMGRSAVRDQLHELRIPYLETSECDFCPHQDRTRWLATSPEKLEEIAGLEARIPGFYFTPQRMPLMDVIELMQSQSTMFDDDADFGCGNNVCGV